MFCLKQKWSVPSYLNISFQSHFDVYCSFHTYKLAISSEVNIYSAMQSSLLQLTARQTIWNSSICIYKDFWKKHFKRTSSKIPFVLSAEYITGLHLFSLSVWCTSIKYFSLDDDSKKYLRCEKRALFCVLMSVESKKRCLKTVFKN